MQKELIKLLVVRMLYPKNATKSLDSIVTNSGYFNPNFTCTCRTHKIIRTL
jgi:hypothetical protein